MIKERVAQLLDKEMDRKSFLIHLVAGFVAIFGASAAFKLLSGDAPSGQNKTTQAHGYGAAPYGR